MVLIGGVGMSEWLHDRGESNRGIKLEFALLFLLQVAVLVSLTFAFVSPAEAHPGRTAADGCHNDRKNGGRHCHGGSSKPSPAQRRSSSDVYYPNCSAARAAGAAPIRRGEPGYASHLDRDGDGIACE